MGIPIARRSLTSKTQASLHTLLWTWSQHFGTQLPQFRRPRQSLSSLIPLDLWIQPLVHSIIGRNLLPLTSIGFSGQAFLRPDFFFVLVGGPTLVLVVGPLFGVLFGAR